MVSYIFLANLGISMSEATGYVRADKIDAVFSYSDEESKYKSVIISGNRQFRSMRSPIEVIGVVETYLGKKELS